MKKMVVVLTVLASVVPAAGGACAAGKLIPPAPIFMPFDSKIVTELNFSSDDVLGIIREILPAAGDLIKMGAAASEQVGKGVKNPVPPEVLAKLDFKPLAEAIEGVSNMRFVAAKYRKGLAPADVAALFDSGAAKAGMLNKIAVDFALTPGVFAAYAQPGGKAYLAYVYDSRAGMVYASRLTGKIDVAKLAKWAGDTIKLFMPGAKSAEPAQPTEQKPQQPEQQDMQVP